MTWLRTEYVRSYRLGRGSPFGISALFYSSLWVSLVRFSCSPVLWGISTLGSGGRPGLFRFALFKSTSILALSVGSYISRVAFLKLLFVMLWCPVVALSGLSDSSSTLYVSSSTSRLGRVTSSSLWRRFLRLRVIDVDVGV